MSNSNFELIPQGKWGKNKNQLYSDFPENSKVLIRVDFNVPIENGKILDDSRISLSLPTINKLLEYNNAIILISHLGRPNGFDKKLSLKPIQNYLKLIFKTRRILFCDSFKYSELDCFSSIITTYLENDLSSNTASHKNPFFWLVLKKIRIYVFIILKINIYVFRTS